METAFARQTQQFLAQVGFRLRFLGCRQTSCWAPAPNLGGCPYSAARPWSAHASPEASSIARAPPVLFPGSPPRRRRPRTRPAGSGLESATSGDYPRRSGTRAARARRSCRQRSCPPAGSSSARKTAQSAGSSLIGALTAIRPGANCRRRSPAPPRPQTVPARCSAPARALRSLRMRSPIACVRATRSSSFEEDRQGYGRTIRSHLRSACRPAPACPHSLPASIRLRTRKRRAIAVHVASVVGPIFDVHRRVIDLRSPLNRAEKSRASFSSCSLPALGFSGACNLTNAGSLLKSGVFPA